MTAVDDLRALVPAPHRPPSPPDWQAARRALGVRFPDDYVQLVQRWGAGVFADVVTLFAPGHPNRHVDLAVAGGELSGMVEAMARAGDAMPGLPGVRDGGLLPWGETDAGDLCLWHIARVAEPEGWTVVLREARSLHVHRHAGGIASFLVAWLGGAEAVPMLGDPPAAPAFEPL